MKVFVKILIFSVCLGGLFFALITGLFLSNDAPLREYLKKRITEIYTSDIKNWFRFNDPLPVFSKLDIRIEQKEIKKLEQQINKRLAFLKNKGMNYSLGSGHWDYVNATLQYNGISYPVKIKIKGDMPSHFNKGMLDASLSVKLDTAAAVLGLRKFSITYPSFENGLYGVLFYRFLNEENFISNRIQFVTATLNGKEKGLCILQEGFAEEMIESDRQREGILVKFENDCIDNNYEYNNLHYPDLIAYSEKKVLSDNILSSQYDRLLQKYIRVRNGEMGASQCFNINRFAKLIALYDIFLAHHSYICQNTKLFYNPVSDLLEPVTWDPNSYSRFRIGLPVTPGFNEHFGYYYSNTFWPVYQIISRDSAFWSLYSKHLYNYTFNNKVLDYIERHKEYIAVMQPLLTRQELQNSFDIHLFYENIRLLKNNYTVDKQVTGFLYKQQKKLVLVSRIELPVLVECIFIKGTRYEINKMVLPFEQVSVTVSGLPDTIPATKFKISSTLLYPNKFIQQEGKIFEKAGHDSIQLFSRDPIGKHLGNTAIINKTILLKGNVTISSTLNIPAGKKVRIFPGAYIRLINGASIISESPIVATGTQKEPITIKSDNGGGILIKNCAAASRFVNTRFLDLQHPSSGNWSLTGAFTGYESNFFFDSCLFSGSHSEDVINFIRSRFIIRNSHFEKGASDMMDADFCIGTITNVTVSTTTNDAFDFSGSMVTLRNITIDKAGDKGISSGEMSYIRGSQITVKNSFIGLASKDLSLAIFEKTDITGTVHPVAAYTKKPSFGHSSLVIQSILNTEASMLNGSLIETNSILFVNKKKIAPNNNGVFASLYPPVTALNDDTSLLSE